jgi:hypothetical protein
LDRRPAEKFPRYRSPGEDAASPRLQEKFHPAAPTGGELLLCRRDRLGSNGYRDLSAQQIEQQNHSLIIVQTLKKTYAPSKRTVDDFQFLPGLERFRRAHSDQTVIVVARLYRVDNFIGHRDRVVPMSYQMCHSERAIDRPPLRPLGVEADEQVPWKQRPSYPLHAPRVPAIF